MENLTFDKLPEAVTQLFNKLNNIESLLQAQGQAQQPEADVFFSVPEAAEFLKLTVPTIYDKAQKGEIPVCKRANRLYFSRQQLTDWLKGSSRKTSAEISAEANTYIQSKKKKAPNDRV